MTTDDNESTETIDQRVSALSEHEARDALREVISAILTGKHPRGVPDVLQRHRLLSRFEVYDADEEARP